MDSKIGLKKQIILLSLFFGAVSLAFIFVLLFSIFQEVRSNSSELISVKRDISLLEKESVYIENFKETYSEIEPNLKKVDSLFVDAEVPVDFISFLEDRSEENDILIKIYPVLIKENKEDFWGSIDFRLSLQCGFNDFSKFLDKLETGPYLIEIQDLFVKSAEQGVDADLTIKVYVK